jgi:chemotaxis protein methyltransferase CheR
MARGDWHAAAQLAGAGEDTPEAAAVAVRALANVDPQAAVRACTEAAARHPLSVDLRYLEGVLLLGQGRLGEAERAIRQALYLEPSLAVAWLTLGSVLRRLRDSAGALRAFRTTERLCAALPPEALLPLGEGERAGALASVARGERERLEAVEPREEG